MHGKVRNISGLPIRWLIALTLFVPVLAGAAPMIARAQQPAAAAPLELPAMALDPATLDAAGFPGYGWLSGDTVGPRALARIAGELTDQTLNEKLQESLEGMGLIEGYQFGLRLIEDPANSEIDVERDIYGSLFEFTSEAGATEGLSFLAALTTEDPEIVRIQGTGALGPDAVYVRTVFGEGEDTDQTLETIFRVGPVIASIQLIDYLGQEPTVEEIESLASLQQQRIRDAIENGTLGLGNKVLRLANPEFGSLFEVRRDHYLRRDGVDLRLSFEDQAETELRAALTGNATDMYALTQFVDNATQFDPSWAEQFGITIRVYRFNDDTAASTWLADRPNQIEADYSLSDLTIQDIQVVADVQTFGDESLMLSYLEVGDFGGQVDRVFIRVANTVADVRFNPLGEMPRAVTESLASLQTQCLIETCPTPLIITEAFLGQTPGEVPSVETPATETTPSAGLTPAATVGVPPASGSLLLDLAAMTLYPADLDDLGLTGFGSNVGEMFFTEDLIASTAANRGIPESEVRSVLEDNGLVRRYEHYLYQPASPADPIGEAGRLIVSYVLEFDDATGAAAAWNFLEDESYSPGASDLPLTTPLGDQSEATHESGTEPSGGPYDQIDLTFQSGNLHAGVAVIDWTGGAVDLNQVEALATRLMERIQSVSTSGTAGLSSQVVRLTGNNVESSEDNYYLLQGEAVRSYGQSQYDATIQTFITGIESKLDGYRLNQRLTAGTEATEDDSWLLIDSIRFADEATATEWVAGTQARIESNSFFSGFQLVQGATVGDQSVSYSVSTADGTLQYRGVVLRIGTVAVTLDVASPRAPAQTAFDAIVQQQVACIMNAGCAEPLPAPPEL